MLRTVVCSKMSAPEASTTRASPRTRRAGCTVAQCGVNDPPRTPSAASIAAASPASSIRSSASVKPRACAVATSSRNRASCAGERASVIVPPRWNCASMPSSSIDPADLVAGLLHRAVQSQRTAAGDDFRASTSHEVGKSALHQPPLRPEAPNPATSCSSTATRRVGSARRR